MSNFTTAWMVVMSLNLLMWLTQTAMVNINPDTSTVFIDGGGGLLGPTQGGGYVVNDTDPYGNFPSGSQTIDPDTGNIFTDIFSSIIDWLSKNLGFDYVKSIFFAPYNLLKAMMPSETLQPFVFAIGTIWHLTTLLLTVLMIWGRE